MPRLRGGRRGICARPAAGGGAAPLCPRWPLPSSGGRAVSGGASLVAGLPLARLRAARGGRLSARLRARPAPVGRGRGFPGAPVVRGRAAPLRASLPRACCPPSAPAPGGRGRRLRRRFVRRGPPSLGVAVLGVVRCASWVSPIPLPSPALRAGGGAGLRIRCGGVSGPSGQISDVKSEITVDKGPKLCYSVIAGLHVNAPSLLRKRPGHIVPGPLSLRHRTPLAAILCA